MILSKLKSFILSYQLACASFLFLLCITVFAYFETKTRNAQKREHLFEYRTSQAQKIIESRLNNYIHILRGAKGLFVSSDTVTRNQWIAYIHQIDSYSNYPGIQAIGYCEYVHAALDSHITRIRAEGFPNYKVFPEGNRPEYTPIVFLEPFSGRNLKAFGFDMFSDPIRKKAMQLARDLDKAIITSKVKLVQETDRNVQAGFLIYLPIYRNGTLTRNIQERRKYITGFIYSAFRATDLMNAILGKEFTDLNIEIYDSTPFSEGTLLFDKNRQTSSGTLQYDPIVQVKSLVVGEHVWKVRFTSLALFHLSADSNLPTTILLGGLIISLLMFVVIWSQSQTHKADKIKQTITDNATAALFMMDINGYCTFMNPAAEEMTGFTLDEIREKPLHAMIHHTRPDGSSYPPEAWPIEQALPTNTSMRTYEDVFIRKDGTFFPVTCAAQPIFQNSLPLSTVIEVRDITVEKRNQQAVVESEARFRNMADNAPVMIWVIDANGQCTYLNRQWSEFTGQSLEQGLGRGWQSVVHSEDRIHSAVVYKEAYEKFMPFSLDYRIRRHDGEFRWTISSAAPRFSQKGEFMGYIGSIIDITERKEAEKQMEENAQLLQKVFLEVPAIVGLLRASDQSYILINPLLSKLFNDRPLLGKTIAEAHPELEEHSFSKVVANVFKHAKPFIGHEMPATLHYVDDQPITGYYNIVCQPLFDHNGQVESILLFAVEVTELVAARKTLLAINEVLSTKNEELLRINNDLDNFVYTASHDLKSPIANLEGLNMVLRKRLTSKLDDMENKMLDMIELSINKLKGTIQDLAEITKVQKDLPANTESLSFEEILEDVKSDNENLILQAQAAIHADFQVSRLHYARKNLRSIIYNLVSNAIKYRSPDRPCQVHITTEEAGEFVILTVQDNGLGIRQEQIHKLFSMFQRLHTHVEGTGIGLYIVKRIIENNGGRIEVESEIDTGTTFRVFFKNTPDHE